MVRDVVQYGKLSITLKQIAIVVGVKIFLGHRLRCAEVYHRAADEMAPPRCPSRIRVIWVIET